MFDFGVVFAHLPRLLEGAQTTLILSAVALFLGAALGMLICTLQMSRSRLVRAVAHVYVSLFRGMPLLVILLIAFYVPPAFGIETTPIASALFGLTLNTGAYQAEIYRAGYSTIPPGHSEAARMLGFTRFQIGRTIIVPQLLRVGLPALTNEAVDVLKSSALVSAIAVTELLRVSQQIVSQTYRPLETYILCALIYFLMNSAIALSGRTLERRLRAAS